MTGDAGLKREPLDAVAAASISGDEDAVSAFLAMKTALERRIDRGHPSRYWLLDLDGSEAVDMVSVVDLVSFGNIAIGTKDWAAAAASMSLHSVDDPSSAPLVLRMLTEAFGQRRSSPTFTS